MRMVRRRWRLPSTPPGKGEVLTLQEEEEERQAPSRRQLGHGGRVQGVMS
jgi:hypothetical protein